MDRLTPPLRRVVIAAVVVLAAVLVATASAAITPDSTALNLANSMSAQPGLVTGASWVDLGGGVGTTDQPNTTNPSSGSAIGTSGPFGYIFPDDGPTFAAMTTGDVSIATPPNNSASAGTDNGTSARGANDVSVLKVDVNVPATANCLSFDFAFYSEEYPEYVGSAYNDGFVAEVDSNTWSVTGPQLSAPDNIAFDSDGTSPVTVNQATMSANTGLQYDGGTALLRARKAVSPGAHSLYLSIYDAGDHIYDSAVFVDNLRALNVPAGECISGAKSADSDLDGIPDDWEENGVDINGDGTIDLNLPAMGAKEDHKDVFIEVDSMQNHVLSNAAITSAMAMFAAAPVSNPDGTTGVHLHVDNGAGSPMTAGSTWGALSRANLITETRVLGSFNGGNYDWDAFDAIKNANFDAARVPVFHYVVFANQYGSISNTSSGISRGIGASDYIVSLGMFGASCNAGSVRCSGTLNQQTGTLVHELGHNLGLRHGGGDDVNNKPNYPSVMNYAFQMGGVPKASGNFWDYSRVGSDTLGSVDETAASEDSGVLTFDASKTAGLRSVHRCAGGSSFLFNIGAAVDWNCSGGAPSGTVSFDVNQDGQLTTLIAFDDWAAMHFKGGAIGGLGLSSTLPSTTHLPEASSTELIKAAQVARGDTKKPKVTAQKRRKLALGKRKSVSLKVRAADNKALDVVYVTDNKTTKAYRPKKADAKKLTASIPLGKSVHKLTIYAMDSAGNTSKVVKLKVKVVKH